MLLLTGAKIVHNPCRMRFDKICVCMYLVCIYIGYYTTASIGSVGRIMAKGRTSEQEIV